MTMARTEMEYTKGLQRMIPPDTDIRDVMREKSWGGFLWYIDNLISILEEKQKRK